MVGKFATILFMLPMIYAHIEIDLSKLNEYERDVRISGNSVHVISDQDVKTFGLSEENLKDTVLLYFGSSPNNVYVKGPTLWGDLYKILMLEPVKRVVAPTKAEVLSTYSEPTLLLKKDFNNMKSKDLSFKTEIRQTIANTVSARWEKEGNFADNIHHLFDLNVTMDSSYFSFISNLGENFEKTAPMTVASQVEVNLKPRQHLIAELLATKRTVMVRVDYETTLTGNVAVNFEKEFNGHRFWALDINTLLTANGMKKTFYSTEIIEFVHFNDAKVLFKDAVTHDVKSVVPVKLF